MLRITTTQDGSAILLRAEGRLTTDEAPEFQAKALAALEAAEQALALDLGALDYIASSGLRVLLMLYKRGAASGKAVSIPAVTDFAREILDETGIGSFFGLTAAEEEDELEEPEYRPVRWEEHERYREYYRRCMILCAETSFMTVFTESETYNITQAFCDGFYWQQMDWEGERVFLPPVGDWDSVDDWQGLLRRRIPAGSVFAFVPAYLLRKWEAFSDRIEVEDMRSEWDYVYSTPKLVAGEGRALAGWRREINTFLRLYPDHSTEPITEASIPELLAFQDRWMAENAGKEKMTQELVNEDRSTRFMLNNWARLPGAVGMILRVEGKLASFLIVEKLDDHMLNGQYQKTDYAYKGASRFLKRELFASLLPQYVMVNNWGDSDLPGLRACKESEDPIVLYKKYRVTWKG